MLAGAEVWLQCHGSQMKEMGAVVLARRDDGDCVWPTASGVGGEGPPDKCSSMIAGARLFFVMAGQVGRAGKKGREPLLLPLLHVLHLQAEGGEAGQEVGHLIHLQDRSKALSGQALVSSPLPQAWRADIVSPPRVGGGFTVTMRIDVQGLTLNTRWSQTAPERRAMSSFRGRGWRL